MFRENGRPYRTKVHLLQLFEPKKKNARRIVRRLDSQNEKAKESSSRLSGKAGYKYIFEFLMILNYFYLTQTRLGLVGMIHERNHSEHPLKNLSEERDTMGDGD